jgi:cellulose synthase/poly-beta-1,6-N-acetylglucosamine synthase-like glycosyltransferase
VNLLLLIIFFVSTSLVFYSYVLYPILISFLAKLKHPKTDENTTLEKHKVIIWMAVYNEEKVIAKKLDSLLQTTYPLDKVAIWIGSDNSNDETAKIIHSYQVKFSNIVFLDYKERAGKSGVLNKMRKTLFEQYAANELQTTLLIPTDANVFFKPDTIPALTQNFYDQTIGQVGANIVNTGVSEYGISTHEKAYINRENTIKYNESAFGVMQGAFGGCYAIRANLMPEIPVGFLMEDFFISLHVLQSRFKCIFEPKAICEEDLPDEVAEEYKRKVRISSGNFQNLKYYFSFLLTPSFNSFCFWSHKGIRWITPFLLTSALLSSLALINTLLFRVAFVIQLLLLFFPLFDKVLKSFGIHIKIVRLIAYFYQMNLALIHGFWLYLKGVKTSAWTPTKRKINNDV